MVTAATSQTASTVSIVCVRVRWAAAATAANQITLHVVGDSISRIPIAVRARFNPITADSVIM